jgi:tetratricopeptide (TPR) repeat protein
MRTILKTTLALVAVLVLTQLSGCGNAAARHARYRDRGAAYLAQKNYQKALVELNNALQIDPKDAQARYLAGQAAEGLGLGRDAVSHYEATLEFDPANSAARAHLSRLYVLAGVADKALSVAETGLRLSPNDPQLLVVRGAARWQLGDPAAALADAEAAAAAAPDDEFVVALLCSLYQQKGDSAKAITVAQSGVDHAPGNVGLRIILAELFATGNRLPEAEAQLKQVIVIDPSDIANRINLAQFYIKEHNVDAAEATIRETVRLMPRSEEAKLALLQFLGAQRGAEQAEAQAKSFLEADPKNDPLKLGVAAYYESTGRTAVAEPLYRAVMDHAGMHANGLTARLRLASIRLAVQDTDEAGRLLADVLAQYPSDADALFEHAQWAMARNDVHTAISDLRLILRDAPSNLRAMRALASAHQLNGEPSLAEEVLRRAVDASPGDTDSRLALLRLLALEGKGDEALQMAQVLVAEQPDNAVGIEQLFALQLGRKDYESARATAMKAVAGPQTSALGHYLLGQAAEAEGHPAAAVPEYEAALASQATYAPALSAITRLDLAQHQPQRALDRLDATLTKSPRFSVAHNLRGELLATLSRYDEAANAFTAANRLTPGWWLPYRNLAAAQVNLKQRDAAIATLERGLARTGAGAELTLALSALYEQAGRTDDAIRVCDELLRQAPGSVDAASNLATLLVTYRNDPGSLTRARQVAAMLSAVDEPQTLSTRGWVAFKVGNYTEAVQLLQRASDKMPDSPQLEFRLGMAQWKNGDVAQARHNLEVAVKSGKDFLGVDEARATLDRIKASG